MKLIGNDNEETVLRPFRIDHILLAVELVVGFPGELFDLFIDLLHFSNKAILKGLKRKCHC